MLTKRKSIDIMPCNGFGRLLAQDGMSCSSRHSVQLPDPSQFMSAEVEYCKLGWGMGVRERRPTDCLRADTKSRVFQRPLCLQIGPGVQQLPATQLAPVYLAQLFQKPKGAGCR